MKGVVKYKPTQAKNDKYPGVNLSQCRIVASPNREAKDITGRSPTLTLFHCSILNTREKKKISRINSCQHHGRHGKLNFPRNTFSVSIRKRVVEVLERK
jgi:hypothetical protein